MYNIINYIKELVIIILIMVTTMFMFIAVTSLNKKTQNIEHFIDIIENNIGWDALAVAYENMQQSKVEENIIIADILKKIEPLYLLSTYNTNKKQIVINSVNGETFVLTLSVPESTWNINYIRTFPINFVTLGLTIVFTLFTIIVLVLQISQLCLYYRNIDNNIIRLFSIESFAILLFWTVLYWGIPSISKINSIDDLNTYMSDVLKPQTDIEEALNNSICTDDFFISPTTLFPSRYIRYSVDQFTFIFITSDTAELQKQNSRYMNYKSLSDNIVIGEYGDIKQMFTNCKKLLIIDAICYLMVMLFSVYLYKRNKKRSDRHGKTGNKLGV